MDASIADVKNRCELSFWSEWIATHGSAPETDYYRKFMMAMGAIDDISFFDDKVCVDVGCGPKGSMTWLTRARLAAGVDPLAHAYQKRFEVRAQTMSYVSALAETVPFSSSSADVVFSMNSLDHVEDPSAACREIRRILRPGGWFIGSLNLDGPVTATEPHPLTEGFLQKHLFIGWEPQFYEIRPKLDSPEHFGPYRYFFEDCPAELLKSRGPKVLWCRFRTPQPSQS